MSNRWISPHSLDIMRNCNFWASVLSHLIIIWEIFKRKHFLFNSWFITVNTVTNLCNVKVYALRSTLWIWLKLEYNEITSEGQPIKKFVKIESRNNYEQNKFNLCFYSNAFNTLDQKILIFHHIVNHISFFY